MIVLLTVLSSQLGWLFWIISVYVVPELEPGNWIVYPAINWERVTPLYKAVVDVEPVYILNGPTAFVSKVSLNIKSVIMWFLIINTLITVNL